MAVCRAEQKRGRGQETDDEIDTKQMNGQGADDAPLGQMPASERMIARVVDKQIRRLDFLELVANRPRHHKGTDEQRDG